MDEEYFFNILRNKKEKRKRRGGKNNQIKRRSHVINTKCNFIMSRDIGDLQKNELQKEYLELFKKSLEKNCFPPKIKSSSDLIDHLNSLDKINIKEFNIGRFINETADLIDQMVFNNFFENLNFEVEYSFDLLDKFKAVGVTIRWSSDWESFDIKDKFVNIFLAIQQKKSKKLIIETLVHEMVHSFLFFINEEDKRSLHGSNFKRILNLICSKFSLNKDVYLDFKKFKQLTKI